MTSPHTRRYHKYINGNVDETERHAIEEDIRIERAELLQELRQEMAQDGERY